MSALVPIVPDAERTPVWGWDRVRALVLDSISSPHSKRAYAQALDEFWQWCQQEPRGAFPRETVQRYRAWLETRGLAPSSRNLHLTVIRKLARDAAANGVLPHEIAAGIADVKGTRQKGARLGVWLTLDQAHALLRAPAGDSLRSKRDRALLALLVGCGLRRSELAELTADRIQQREGRWVLVDVEGKGSRVRSVPMPAWAKVLVDHWTAAAGIGEGRLFRAISQKGEVGEALTA